MRTLTTKQIVTNQARPWLAIGRINGVTIRIAIPVGLALTAKDARDFFRRHFRTTTLCGVKDSRGRWSA